MKTYNIFTNKEDSLPQGKADFLLAGSLTKTYEIKGIIQAEISEEISNPTLDAEFISNQKFFSLGELAKNSKALPSLALITRAVHNLSPFSSIEVLDLGLEFRPKQTSYHTFDISPSNSIIEGSNIDAKDIFYKGMLYGKKYELKGSYLILGESIPSGITTATASCLALGYDCENDFFSSFVNTSNSIKAQTIQKALSHLHGNMSNFEKLSLVSDNMLLFCAGFLLEASRRFHIVLAGGRQMAACLLIADKLREDVLMQIKSDNITLATTAWIVNDKHSDIKHLLSLLSYTPHAIYTTFSFADTEIVVLKNYDDGELKEGVGAGAALAYIHANGFTNDELLDAIELIVYTL